MLIEIDAPLGVLGVLGGRSLPGGTSVELERTASVFDCPSPTFVIAGSDAAAVVRAIRAGPSVEDVTVVGEAGDETVIRVGRDGTVPELFEHVRDADGTVLSAITRDDVWRFELRFVDRSAASQFYTGYGDGDYPITIRQTNPRGTGHGALQERITAEQREALSRAVEGGYFEVPRRITLIELADELGISDTAVSQRLRRGLSNVLWDYAYSPSEPAAPPRRDD